jgi:hydroxypyruvate reductase
MRAHVRIEGRNLFFGTKSDNELPPIDLDCIRRIAVVGAGKAGAGMSQALEQILGPALMREKQLMGWVNVPADCVQPLQRIHLHPARPAGRNEPTAEGVAGTERVLQIAGELGDDDLCIALISGGGSALTPAPIEGISLADKLEVTRFLSAVGADISELNTVRKQLSRFKGGGLARTCKAGRLVSLIISDVIAHGCRPLYAPRSS